MEFTVATVVGILFACGTYMILRPNLIRMVMGFGLYANGANLLLIACGGYRPDWQAPFYYSGSATGGLMDPLPPDIILTAIVINFAVGALMLVLCYRIYLDHGSDDPEALTNAAVEKQEARR